MVARLFSFREKTMRGYVRKVPSGYWKIVAVENGTTIRSAAFIMSQDMARSASFCGAIVTIREVERRAGLVFFPDLSDEQRGTLKDAAGDLASGLGCSSPEARAGRR
jgi:DNA/RNA endonuclease G (NUC1)